jgi:hypothetical protein
LELLKNKEKISALLGRETPKTENKEEEVPDTIPIKQILQAPLTKFSKVPVAEEPLYDQFCFSGFNPPPAFRRLQEDFFYLQFKSQEGAEFQITASCFGFFVNLSTRKNFDPRPNTHFTLEKNLFTLLCSLSVAFKTQFNILLEKEAKEGFT